VAIVNHEQTFNSVGWFSPPYVQMGVLTEIANEVWARASLPRDPYPLTKL
jgi:hypothetical protein